MAVIEGYTFAVDMQDRGVVASLRQMRSAASAMKAEMRAGFETIQHGEGSLSAYNYRLEQSHRMIENYKNMQASLRKELESLNKAREKEIETNGRVTDATEKQYDKVSRNIENYQHQINQLRQSQREARQAIAQLNTGLIRTRTETENIKSVTQAYVRSVTNEGRAFTATKAQAQAYKVQHQALVNQYRAEVSETGRLSSQLDRLKTRYSYVKANVDRLKASNQTNSAEYSRMSGRMQVLGENIDRTNAKMSKQITTALRVKTSIGEISRAERSVTDGGISHLSRAMNNLDANARRATSHTREWAQSVRGDFAVASMAMIPFGAAIGKSVQMSSQLQAQWITTKNLLVTGGEKVSEVTKNIGQMQRDASKYSKEYGFSQKEIADQYTELVKRGYTSESALGSMKSMLEAARASGDDFNDVVKSSSQVLDAFGLQGKNASEQMSNTKRVVNSMAYSADMTATSFKDLGVAMSYVSASASQAGFSVEETSAAIGILSNSGVEASQAGTGLRKVINSILSPTRNAQEALKKVGLSIDDFKNKDGSLKSMADIFKQINRHTEKLGKADKGAFFKAMFGTTGQQAGEILAQSMSQVAKGNKNLEQLTENVKKAEKGNGYVHKLATKNMQSTQMQLKQLKMNIQDIAINMGNKLLPAVNDVAKAMSDWVGSKAGQKAIGDFGKSISSLARIISRNSKSIFSFTGGFVEGFTGIFKISGFVVKSIGAVGEAIGLLVKNVENALGIKQRSIDIPKYLGEITGGVVGLVAAFKILKGTFNGLSALKQDFLSLFRINKENDKIKLENDELERNIALWKEHNLVSGGDSAIGSDIISSQKEKPTLTTSIEKGSTTKEVEKGVEGIVTGTGIEVAATDAGVKSGARFLDGFLSGAKGLTRGILGLILPTGFLNLGERAGQKFLNGFAKVGKVVGSKFATVFLSSAGRIKDITKYISDSRVIQFTRNVSKKFGDIFSKSARNASKKFGDVFLKSARVSRNFASKWIVPETWKKVGTSAASSFSSGFSYIKRTKTNSKRFFKGVEQAGANAGAKTGESFLTKFGEKLSSSKVAMLGKGLGKRLGGPFMIAFGAIDIARAWNTSTNRNRAKNVGSSIGNLAGIAAGGKMGAVMGSFAGPIGTVFGGIVGSIAGGIIGSKIGKQLGPAFKKFGHGAVKTWDLIFKEHNWSAAWNNLGKSWKSFWNGMGNWWDKVIGKKTSKPKSDSKSSNRNSSGNKSVKSLGNTRYSKSDVQNLKAMTAQIDSYEKALKGLKSVIKTNDPTSELRHMNSELKGASSNWGKVAKPIKEIGDAFKYLSQFTNSMAKKDAFAAFNDDLPKLDGTVKKYGKSLIKNIDSLGKSLKNNSLEKPLKKISSEIKDSTKKWKEFASPVKSLSKSFKTLQNATKTLVGKNGLEATKKGFTDLNNALKKQKIGAYIKKLAGDLKNSKVTTYLTRMDKSVKNSAKYWRSLAKPLKSLAGSFNTLQKSVRGLNGKKTGFTALNSDVRNLYRTIRKNPFGRLIAQQANIANKAMSGKKSGFVNEFNRQTRSMDRALRSFKREFDRDWRSTWSGLDRPVSRNLGSASRSVDRYLDDIQSTRSKFSSSFLKGWDSWIDDVVSNFRKGFNKLPGYAQSSMKDIISRLNKGISGINSTISNFGGDKKLSTISYANGTNGGHPGGHMLVNDSVRPHWKELVLFPNGQALLPQHRNTLIPNAPRGTQVLSGESTYKFMNSIGVHKYADGTLSESEMDKLSEQFEKRPEEAAKTLILKMTNWNSRVPLVADLGPASAIAFAKAISNVLKDQMASEANPGGAGVARWRPVIIKAFHALGVDPAGWKVNKLLKQIETESGGDPHAWQGIHDVNSGGNEARGLLQFAGSTWKADALPGHTDWRSGYNEILAAINVLEHGGEGGWGNVGMGHGWATGGFATKHGLYEVAEEGLPEAIIPLDVNKRPRALSLIDHTLDKMEQDGGGTGGLRSRRAQSQSNDETTAYLKQAVTFLAQIVGLNKQQIDAILANGGNDDIRSRHARQRFYQQYGNDQRVSDYMNY